MDGAAGPTPRRWQTAAVVAVVVVALVAGARLAGVALPDPTPPPTIDVTDVADGRPDAGRAGRRPPPSDRRDGRDGRHGHDGRDGHDGWILLDGRWVSTDTGEVLAEGETPPDALGSMPYGTGPAHARTTGALADHPSGTWRTTSSGAPIAPRPDAVALWTGDCARDDVPPLCGEVIVWGGGTAGDVAVDGAAYDPEAGTWRAIPAAPVRATTPLPAVWADGLVVVWGGVDPTGLSGRPGATRAATGAVYDPVADRWQPLPAPPISGRAGHGLVWTGREVVVWGGGRRSVDGGWLDLDDGAAYDPQRREWRLLTPSPLRARTGVAAVAAGHRVVVWGGHRGGVGDGGIAAPLSDGAVYNSFTDAWSPLPQLRTQAVRERDEPVRATLLADGDRILLAAPFVVSWRRSVFATHELGRRRWRLVDAPGGVRWPGAAVRGDPDRVVVWGGRPSRRPRPDGVVAIVGGAAWPLGDGGPPPRAGQAVAWTGDTLFVWGGEHTEDRRIAVWSASGP